MSASRAEVESLLTYDDEVVSAEVLRTRFQYVFSPVESLRPDAKTSGVGTIAAGQLQVIRTHRYPDRALEGERNDIEAVMRIETNYAEAIADSFYRAYGFTGLVVVRSMAGAPVQVRNWLQRVLLEGTPENVLDKRAEIRSRPLLAPRELGEVAQAFFLMARTDPLRLGEAVRAELLNACDLGEAYLRQYYGSYMSEMAKRKNPNEFGIGVVHPKLRWVCAQLKITAPDDVAAEIERLRQEASRASGAAQVVFPPEFTEWLRSMVASQMRSDGTVAEAPMAAGDVKMETPGIPQIAESERGEGGAAEPVVEGRTIGEKEERVFGDEEGKPKRGPDGRFSPRG